MARLSREDLEHMKRAAGQPVRTDKLISILKSFGFEIRNNASHVIISHPEYNNIKVSNLVAGSKKRTNNKVVAWACLAVLDIEEPELEDDDDILEPVSLSAEDFAAAADPEKIYHPIPDDMELVRGRKNPGYYLRHKKYPQLATRLENYERGDDVSITAAYLNIKAEDLHTLVTMAVEEYDFDKIDLPGGAFTLVHKVAPNYGGFKPFRPRNENFSCVGEVETLMLQLEEAQSIFKNEHLPGIVRQYGAHLVGRTPEGHFRYEMRGGFTNGEAVVVDLEASPKGFYSLEQIIDFRKKLEEEFWRHFKRHIEQRYGFVVRSIGANQFEARHPIFQMGFEITKMDALPMPEIDYDEFYDNKNGAMSDDEYAAKQARMLLPVYEYFESWENVRLKIYDVLEQCGKLLDKRFDQYRRLLEAMRWKTAEIPKKEAVKMGQLASNIIVKDCDGAAVMRCRGMCLQNGDEKPKVVLTNDSIIELANAVQARLQEIKDQTSNGLAIESSRTGVVISSGQSDAISRIIGRGLFGPT